MNQQAQPPDRPALTRFSTSGGPIHWLAAWRIQEKLVEVRRHLSKNDRVLDIGSGNCLLAASLMRDGLDVTPLDIRNGSFLPDVQPEIYDGAQIPFDDDTFDVATLITVLHHTRQPNKLVAEASRVARRIIVIEEIYVTRVRKYVTYFIDSLFNLEFRGHPHTNRTDEQWRHSFRMLGLSLQDASYSTSFGCLSRVTYALERDRS